MTALSREEIHAALHREPPLLEGYVNLEAQLQPSGFDLSLQRVAQFTSAGQLGATNAQRVLAEAETIPFSGDGLLELAPGPYLVTFNEVVNFPTHLMALGKPRSSLLRSGVAVHNAVWDAGYSGRSQALLVVYNAAGFWVARNARLIQLVFLPLSTAVEVGYTGRYQGENL